MSEALHDPEDEAIRQQIENDLQFNEAGDAIDIDQGVERVRQDASLDTERFRDVSQLLAETPDDYSYREPLRRAMDAPTQVLDYPYGPDRSYASDKEPPYDPEFQKLALAALRIANDRTNPYRENAMAMAGQRLKDALAAKPEQMGALIALQRKIANNHEGSEEKATAKANSHIDSKNSVSEAVAKAHTKEDLPERPTRGQHTMRPKNLLPRAWRGKKPDVNPDEDDAIQEKQANKRVFGVSKLTIQWDIPRGTPGITSRPRLLSTFDLARADWRTEMNRIQDKDYDVAHAMLAQNEAFATEKRYGGYAAEDKQKLQAMDEVFKAVAYDPSSASAEDLIGMNGTIEAHAEQAAINLAEWRKTAQYEYGSDGESYTFASLSRLHDYVKSIDIALEDMPQIDPHYGELVGLRAQTQQVYNSVRYRQEQLHIERAASHEEGFVGRYEPTYREDRSIALNDGSNTVLYPDGSYDINDGSKPPYRRNADGTIWSDTEPVVPLYDRKTLLETDLTTPPMEQYGAAARDWFIYHDDETAREFHKYASLISRWNAAEADKDPDNVNARIVSNTAAYWKGHFEASLLPDSTVRYDKATFYGTEGTWRIWPDGSMQQLRDSRDDAEILATYAPDGTRF